MMKKLKSLFSKLRRFIEEYKFDILLISNTLFIGLTVIVFLFSYVVCVMAQDLVEQVTTLREENQMYQEQDHIKDYQLDSCIQTNEYLQSLIPEE